MAKNISLMGASYSDVPAVVLPQTGGGTARFDDASVTTATSSDVAQGKVFIAADGTITTGTASGGGSIVVVDTPDGHGGTIREITATNVTTLVEKTITENGTYDPSDDDADGYSSVTVNVSGGSSTPVERSDVNFYDYDGTLLYAYTAAEAAELTEMPSNPSHSGLTAQGWNYTLAQMKTEVTAQGACDIGQMYVTDDGKTRIYIHLEDGRLHPYLGICPNGTVVVDWGDNSATSTLTGTSLTSVKFADHVYASGGYYIITLTVSSGSFQIYGASGTTSLLQRDTTTTTNNQQVYHNSVIKVEIGTNASIGSYAFYGCYSLSNITIPSGVTSIDVYAFSYCYSLSSITIPSGVTSIYAYAFKYCYALSNITLPSGVTSIGDDAFNACNSLSSITIPSGVTSIGNNAFISCNSLSSIALLSGVTSIGDSTFSSCNSLSSIALPSGVTSIDVYAFSYCYSLSNITLPSGLTSIGNYAFSSCHSLSNITIPSGVTNIGNNAFYNCYGLGEIHFASTTPPTVSNKNAWTHIPSDCKIYVPTGSLSAYTSATNYPSSSTYTYIEE